MDQKKIIKILFVCLGNICRSPLAEAIFLSKIKKEESLNTFSADSAGTGAYHIGKNPDDRSIKAAKNHHIPIHHRARQITFEDASEFDYILAMDDSNYENILNIIKKPHKGLFLMRKFDPEMPNANVPDPYHGGEEGFEEIYQILDRSISGFIKYLRKQHSL